MEAEVADSAKVAMRVNLSPGIGHRGFIWRG